MKRHMLMLPVFLVAAVALILVASAPDCWAQEEFEETKIIIEINAKDGDAGLQALGDADAWKEVRIMSPDGKKIFDLKAKRNLRKQGLTEIFFESDEPSCEEQPLDVFLALFPPGEYLFTGKTVDGDKLEGEATLTHNLPAEPVILQPVQNEDPPEVDPENTVIVWEEGDDLGECDVDGIEPSGEIVGWEVVVEPEDDELVDPLRVFTIQLPTGQTSVKVPPEYLNSFDPSTEFKFEIIAIEESGNQTITEGTFVTQAS